MANVNMNLPSGLSGKIGKLIFYQVGNKTYMRRSPKRVRQPNTKGQLLQRSKVTGAQVVYRFVKGGELERVFAAWAMREGAWSGYHLFMSKNMNAFGLGNYVDYGKLVFSGGELQLPHELELVEVTTERVGFSWKDNSAGMTAGKDDRLRAVWMTDDEPYRVVMAESVSGMREEGRGSLVLPEGDWKVMHVYVFFSSEDGTRYSPSVYFKVMKPEND